MKGGELVCQPVAWPICNRHIYSWPSIESDNQLLIVIHRLVVCSRGGFCVVYVLCFVHIVSSEW